MIKAIFYFNDNTVTVHSENTKEVTTKFNPGYYSVRPRGDGAIDIRAINFKEVHTPFPNQRASEVIDSATKFLDSRFRKQCNSMGYTYKLNMLLHGKQGVGKTALLQYLGNGMVEKNGAIVFRVDNTGDLEATWVLAEEIRKIQDNPIVFVMDEFERYCSKGSEGYIKTLLDGDRSIDNSMVLAATNYLDRIPPTLKERPSRFRIVSKIEPISDKSVIRNLIANIHNKADEPFLDDEQIDMIAERISPTTVDEVKTSIIDVLMDISIGIPDKESVGFTSTKSRDKDSSGESYTDEEEAFKKLLDQFEKEHIREEKELAMLSTTDELLAKSAQQRVDIFRSGSENTISPNSNASGNDSGEIPQSENSY